MSASPERLAAIGRIKQGALDRLVDAISRLMERHPEPYRTLAECLILDRGEGAAESMAEEIDLAVQEDCGDGNGEVRL